VRRTSRLYQGVGQVGNAALAVADAALGALTAVLAAQPSDDIGASSAVAKWRLFEIVFLMFVTVLVAASTGLSSRRTSKRHDVR